MEIKIFKCGLCKDDKRVSMTRKGLRKHLEEEHRIVREKFNGTDIKNKKHKQNWVINGKW